MESPYDALRGLFLSLFSGDELRRFLHGGAGGEGLVRELPGSLATPAALSHEAVDVLKRRGQIDARLFDRLAVATWEATLARQDLCEGQGDNTKFIPVLFEGEARDSLPKVLRPYTHYRLMEGYDRLVREIGKQPEVEPVPFGAPNVPALMTSRAVSLAVAKAVAVISAVFSR